MISRDDLRDWAVAFQRVFHVVLHDEPSAHLLDHGITQAGRGRDDPVLIGDGNATPPDGQDRLAGPMPLL